ncbi:patatin-like phospholipase family protein [Nocardia sp. NRRL WC-3656]|uniref:patatin-like phospholipase family protein n=1 Tax=Nocardia sp. NRRL WC-3656 TaxID=1463824 RepID=UPI0009DD3FC7|nr:patatin-like phospholipase family protein [Nocardia sp. NRRL WC-3656]
MQDSTGSELRRYWDPEHPVLRILRARRDSGSLPHHRSDGARVALTIEGGGMRGVTSAAILTQLDDYGFKNAFDVVYGSSAGAINGAYFLTQDSWYPLSIYYEDLAGREFVDFSRALRRRPIMNLDYLFGVLMRSRKPLQYQSVVDSPIPLVVAVTDVDALQTATLRDFPSAEALETALRASTWLPIAVPGAMELDGRRMVDGGLITPLCFKLAVKQGCTHVLSLSTRHPQTGPSRSSWLHRWIGMSLDRISLGLGNCYLESLRQRAEDETWLAQQRLSTPSNGPHVLDLSPLPWMSRVTLDERDRYSVLAAGRQAYSLGYCATEAADPELLRDGRIRTMPRLTVVRTTGATYTPVPAAVR